MVMQSAHNSKDNIEEQEEGRFILLVIKSNKESLQLLKQCGVVAQEGQTDHCRD